jgi:transcription elongation GreA/GreB family factor
MTGSAPARVYSANVVHAIRGRINFDTSGAATGIEIGTIPAGSFVMGTTVHIVTAFNAGTTNVLVVGTAADDDGFAVAAGTLSGAAGLKSALFGAQSGDTLLVDTPVVLKWTQTGTAATTGAAQVIVNFYPHAT